MLTEEDMVLLLGVRGCDFDAVCHAADTLRSMVNGDTVTYVVNRNINYTNMCTYKYVWGFCVWEGGGGVMVGVA